MADPLSPDELDLPTFADELNTAGVTSDYLINKLKKELDAKETKFFQHEGKVVDSKDVIAWGIRQNARKDAHKLKGDYPAEKVEHTVSLEDKLRAIHEKRDQTNK